MIRRLPLVLIFLAACASGTGTDPARSRGGGGQPNGPPDLRGTITARTPDTIRVEAAPADPVGSPKAVVRLAPDTEVRARSGRAVSAAALQVGQVVSVWFSGPVLESYPVQGQGRRVLLEDAPGSAGP